MNSIFVHRQGGDTTRADLSTGRGRHVFVISFLLSGRTPGELLAQKQPEAAKAVLDYIRSGGPAPDMAMTDPVMFARLRSAITRLMMGGWY